MNFIEQILRAFQPLDRVVKRRSTKGKVRERDPARIKRKKRRQQAKQSRQVNYARAKKA